MEHYLSLGHDVLQAHLLDRDASLLTRSLVAAGYSYRKLAPIGPDLVVVAGLGAPHMLFLGTKLARRVDVVFDSCDSWSLQLSARRAAHARTLALKAGIALTRRASVDFSYISTRDAAADAALLDGTPIVIPPHVNPELAQLAPVSYPLERLVIAADLRSFHNLEMLDMVLRAASQTSRETGVRLEIFGHASDRMALPENVRHLGWVDHLSSVYDGNTGVVITNSPGSGLPNKAIEAMQARRPMALHHSIDYLPHVDPRTAYWFHDEQSLSRSLLAMVRGEARDEGSEV
ncbi:glycosyltransferase [Microbacterium lacus]|uniref:glycosyltransferase n=1 Tax=Microbacterium lacus TaxID=415217 RepID=UPI000C2BF493|nr:glycosyltransferase [Microbacterium lacus]